MKNKVSFLLSHFNVLEINKLRKFILSPYFNSNQVLLDLYEILLKDLDTERRKEKSKEDIWKLLYKGKPYDDVRFRKLNSELLKLVEQYLAQEVYDQNPMRQSNYLMDAVGKKKITTLYNSTIKNARSISEKNNKIETSHFYYLYEMESNYYNIEDFEISRSGKANIENIINNLDQFYFIEKLRWYCTILSRQTNASLNYNLKFIEEIIDYLNENEFENELISIFYSIVQLYLNPDEKQNFYNLQIKVNNSKEKINESVLLDIYNHLLNYCINQGNKGSIEFLDHYININELLINMGLIFKDGYLSPWRFKNIVQAALRINKFDWTEIFIKKNKEFIHPDFRENAVTYNLAMLFFYQKKYDDVISQLQNVEYEDEAYNLGSKSMLLAVYYEMDYLEPLYSLFDSFRAYISRNKTLSEARKLSYSNLIKFTRQLSKINTGDTKSIDKIKKDVSNESNIASDKWLMEKIKEKESK